MLVMSSLRGPHDWRAGDKVYFDRNCASFQRGDIVTVKEVVGSYIRLMGYTIRADLDCMLRVLQPGDVVPNGTKYKIISGYNAERIVTRVGGESTIAEHCKNCLALISVRTDRHDAIERIAAANRRVAIAHKELDASIRKLNELDAARDDT